MNGNSRVDHITISWRIGARLMQQVETFVNLFKRQTAGQQSVHWQHTRTVAGRNGARDFHGEKRSNATHASTTDPDAKLFRKSSGQPAQLCHMGHLLMEHRSGLVVDTRLTHATGTAERDAAASMLGDRPGRGRITVADDKLYDTQDFVAEMRRLGVTPHVARHTNGRRSAIDGRTTRHAGYAVSQRIHKRIEEGFGWMKTVGGLRKTRHRGTARVGWQFTLTMAA